VCNTESIFLCVSTSEAEPPLLHITTLTTDFESTHHSTSRSATSPFALRSRSAVFCDALSTLRSRSLDFHPLRFPRCSAHTGSSWALMGGPTCTGIYMNRTRRCPKETSEISYTFAPCCFVVEVLLIIFTFRR